jgi:hypothetical protein
MPFCTPCSMLTCRYTKQCDARRGGGSRTLGRQCDLPGSRRRCSASSSAGAAHVRTTRIALRTLDRPAAPRLHHNLSEVTTRERCCPRQATSHRPHTSAAMERSSLLPALALGVAAAGIAGLAYYQLSAAVAVGLRSAASCSCTTRGRAPTLALQVASKVWHRITPHAGGGERGGATSSRPQHASLRGRQQLGCCYAQWWSSGAARIGHASRRRRL